MATLRGLGLWPQNGRVSYNALATKLVIPYLDYRRYRVYNAIFHDVFLFLLRNAHT